jgi:hypothetical protein
MSERLAWGCHWDGGISSSAPHWGSEAFHSYSTLSCQHCKVQALRDFKHA